jgi:hypothetical protein
MLGSICSVPLRMVARYVGTDVSSAIDRRPGRCRMRFHNRKHVPIGSLGRVRLSPQLACAHCPPFPIHSGYVVNSLSIVLSIRAKIAFESFLGLSV